MLIALSKLQKWMISMQKAPFNEVIEKEQTALAQKKQEQKKIKASYEEKVDRLVVQVRELEEQVLRGEIGGGREGGAEEKGGRGRDGAGRRRRRRSRNGGGEYEEAEEVEKAEERDASPVNRIPLSVWGRWGAFAGGVDGEGVTDECSVWVAGTRNVLISTCASGATHAEVIRADEAFVVVAEDRSAVLANMEAVEDPGVMRRLYFSRSLNGGGSAEAGVCGFCGHVAGGEASGAEEERCDTVGKNEWGRTVPEGLC
ncbi:uncharacterized protein MONOS_428 [Monocercomonoides exilis]|uniref:uncharacterized protein n=1 Tax=Monocercomonoides exilis TaxID=2049356 RepID=UPI00355A8B1C|nr:hypothetical protein MONOS_428 [Monocercomonoides exilis]|eukprot:MONOS_428.1-p1 / transcript=MONOS_428.1 / gene=MONOS_428 / organism=Monocercomonoides_exilis_PA203 / gene_product=unspecified product / transcript_product=unspecified product / location=Mono_scaffold00007:45225-46188(-) / protein_length=257 / sequence_SO=supercontig / SO=protein_coding / is_pseudo=false